MSPAGIHPRRVMPDARCGGTLDGMATAPAQLLVYRFGADAGFEGQLVGALERSRRRTPGRCSTCCSSARDGTGELFAVAAHGGRAGGIVARLLGFRLDVEERRRLTGERALRGGPSADAHRAPSGELLPAGDAIAAVLVGEAAANALDDAVARLGGRALVSAPGGVGRH